MTTNFNVDPAFDDLKNAILAANPGAAPEWATHITSLTRDYLFAEKIVGCGNFENEVQKLRSEVVNLFKQKGTPQLRVRPDNTPAERLALAACYVDRLVVGIDACKLDRNFAALELIANGVAMLLDQPVNAGRDIVQQLLKPMKELPDMTMWAIRDDAVPA